MELHELQKAANDLVAGYKASGMSASDIATLLVFGLRAIAVDPETDAGTLAALASVSMR